MEPSNVLTVEVPVDEVEKVQRADIEQSARREIIVSCIDRGIGDHNPTFVKYQNEYNMWFTEFMRLKREIEVKYVESKNAPNLVARSWNLNYETHILTIKY